ncbi:hypothetical protein ANN_24865 [Periplaneta americana]|uniref:Uncharacterized protein n=1 Tax=Periplaneta americana TaxID=6978 RepID=A0ABQ8S009_PERAM|nr:hypothetical protein ANN_24865 [Periplaneta americana]
MSGLCRSFDKLGTLRTLKLKAAGSSTPWPVRSPKLNPLDFWLWGYMKKLVYATPINNVQTVQDRVFKGCQHRQEQPGQFQRVRDSLRQMAEECITMNGRHNGHLSMNKYSDLRKYVL